MLIAGMLQRPDSLRPADGHRRRRPRLCTSRAPSRVPVATIRLTDKRHRTRLLLLHPELALGEGYMDGRIIVEEGSIL
jgi:hypothetical protein